MKNPLIIILCIVAILIAFVCVKKYRKPADCGCNKNKIDGKKTTVCLVDPNNPEPMVISPQGEDPLTTEGSKNMEQRTSNILQNYMQYSSVLPPAMYAVVYDEQGNIIGQKLFNPVAEMIQGSYDNTMFNKLFN